MKIVVPIQLVPDLVEELVVDSSGAALDRESLRWKLSEPDDHAIEQAILLKEKGGGEVVVLAPDLEGVDDVLFAAAAKGADKLIKLTGDFEGGFNEHAVARAFLPWVKEVQPDLVLTGVQTHNGLDGAVGAIMAEYLAVPYVGYISGVSVAGGKATLHKDYPGGLRAEIEVALPAVLGISSAESAPRYVPISKVRQVMKTSRIDTKDAGGLDLGGAASVKRMFPPEVAERATMIQGSAEEVAAKLAAIMKEQGLV
ncbi:MAG TPA: electron transfer flavoprotein subunit beta/FixA family protein [Thermodesulfobacteriota bacterium]|nr:electron transfer flavoprotein subunit beta/FixA family protein [Thermodesulfobacteriota bacterium]